jgi:formate-dependent nitrite reductase membrane component NrfD
MDTDLYLTIGLVLVVLTIPSLLSAWTEGRAPRVGSILLLAGGGLIVVALSQRPGGYAFEDIPQAFVSVFDRYVR